MSGKKAIDPIPEEFGGVSMSYLVSAMLRQSVKPAA